MLSQPLFEDIVEGMMAVKRNQQRQVGRIVSELCDAPPAKVQKKTELLARSGYPCDDVYTVLTLVLQIPDAWCLAKRGLLTKTGENCQEALHASAWELRAPLQLALPLGTITGPAENKARVPIAAFGLEQMRLKTIISDRQPLL